MSTIHCEPFMDKEFEKAKEALLSDTQCDWELFAESETVKIYREINPETGLYAYKLFGKLIGVTPELFSKVYSDLAYRKTWDSYVNDARVLSEDGGRELIYWQVNFPWPMDNRDYVYIREMRNLTSDGEGSSSVYVFITRSVFQPPVKEIEQQAVNETKESTNEEPSNEPAVPVETNETGDVVSPWVGLIPEAYDGVVRVKTYTTTMSFTADEDGGTKLCMYYSDNPEGTIPVFFVNYAAKQGISSFLNTMKQAADNYEEYLKANKTSEEVVKEEAPVPEEAPVAEESDAVAVASA